MTKPEYISVYCRTPTKFRNGIRRMYYSQYTTAEVVAFLLRSIPKKVILESKDYQFNDVRDGNWKSLVQFMPSTVSDKLQENGDWLSVPTGICILKEAAQQIRERA